MTATAHHPPAADEYHRLERRLLEFMESPAASPGERDEAGFTQLALEIFRFQFQHNPPYQQWCRHLGVDQPASITTWQQIPAAPASAFKDSGLDLNCFPPQSLQTVFLTSGTTHDQHRRGKHGFYSVKLYQRSILAAWGQSGLPSDLPCLFLTQSPQDAPESSLSHMMGVLSVSSPAICPQPFFISADGTLDHLRLAQTCHSLDRPVLVFGTALAFLKTIEHLAATKDTLNLPPGSLLCETGGYKGSGRSLDKVDFYSQLTRVFATPTDNIFNEYSMTELSSQFYSFGLDRPHMGPPWTRIQVIDPATLQAVPPGQTGHLQILDLANLASLAAIRTEDLATAADAPSAFHLLGRDPAALPRGCSRSADEMLNS